MKKILLILFLSIFSLTNGLSKTVEKIGEKERITVGYQHDLSKVLKAIIYVESRGDVNAISKNKQCVGILQITPILVKDCNQFVKSNKYTLKDRYDKSKSFEMFYLIQKRYNKDGNIKQAIYKWRGGSPKENHIYYTKVMNKMQRL